MFFNRYDHRITTSLCGVDTTIPRMFIHSSPCPCFRGGLCFTPRSLSGPQGCVKVPDLRPAVASMLQLLHSNLPTVWAPDIAGPHFDSFILPLFSPFIVAHQTRGKGSKLTVSFQKVRSCSKLFLWSLICTLQGNWTPVEPSMHFIMYAQCACMMKLHIIMPMNLSKSRLLGLK